MHLPDHLEHQELVEIRVEQRPDRRDRSGTRDCRRGLRYPWPSCDLMGPFGKRQGRVAAARQGGIAARYERNRFRGRAATPHRRASACSSPASSTSCARPSASPRSSSSRTPAARVVVPAQTCCGQPAYNSGDRATAKALARQAIEAFEDCDYVVAPSGSCGGMLIRHYPELFAGEPEMAAKAERFAEKTHELVSFLTDVLGVERVSAAVRRDGRLSRLLLGPARARRQGAAEAPARQRRGPEPRRARRGRDLLRLRRHVRRQIRRTVQRHRLPQGRRHPQERAPGPCSPATSAASSTSPASFSARARRSRRGTSPRCWPAWRTGRRSASRRRRPDDDRRRDHAAVQGERPRGADRRAAAGRDGVRAQLRRPARGGGRAAAGVRGAARQRPRHQGPHARASRPLSRGLRAQGRRRAAAMSISPRTPRRRAGSSSTSARGSARKASPRASR